MDWDGRYRSGDTPWCKGRAHPMLQAMIDATIPIDFSGRIVVPGCGRGWDLAAIAASRPLARLVGIDLSPSAIDATDATIRENPCAELIVGDFLDPDWLAKSVGGVDMIWEHTCFCAIHPSRRADYVRSAASVLSGGGILMGMFFLDFEDDCSGPPWNCPPHELEQRFGQAFHVLHCEPAIDTFEGRQGEEFAVRMRRKS